MNPAVSAKRILLGTGLGLILATGFGLVSNQFSMDKIGFEIIFPITGLILIFLSINIDNGATSLLNSIFPNEDEHEMASRINEELIQFSGAENVGDAWAKLEKTVLVKELEEE